MWPYWAYSYSPDPFQPALTAEETASGQMGRCPGFDDDKEHYSCWPPPHEYSNCWKCPPKVSAHAQAALTRFGIDLQVQQFPEQHDISFCPLPRPPPHTRRLLRAHMPASKGVLACSQLQIGMVASLQLCTHATELRAQAAPFAWGCPITHCPLNA